MTLEAPDPEGATPLGPGEIGGLKPTWVTTRADLNDAEQSNIIKAMGWVRRVRKPQLLTEAFAIELHRRMFGDVWNWAGTLRRRQTNIGVEPEQIRVSCRMLLDDVSYWISNATYGADEIAVRLHHRLVQIHPFPNGNGRHTRLMADLLVEQLDATAFSWGRADLLIGGATRQTYIGALRAADASDLSPLLAFARS